MRIKKLLVALIAFIIFATGLVGNQMSIKASSDPSVYMTSDVNLTIKPGETTHINIPIQATSFIPVPTITLKPEDGAPFTLTKPTISLYGSSVQGIYSTAPVDLEFDVKVKETAKIKDYKVDVIFTYEDYINYGNKTYTMTLTLKVQDEKTPAQLTVSSVKMGSTTLGSDTNLSFTVKNEGELLAKSIYLVMDYKNIIDEGYSAKKIKVGDLASGDTKNITLPISILTTATPGRNTLVANFTYKTTEGDDLTSGYDFYINLSSNSKAPKLKIKDVKFPEGLKASDKFNLSVNIGNSGEGSAKDITVNIDETTLTQDGIVKNYFTSGIDVEDIKSDASKTVKIPLKVSKYATGGMKNLKVIINYKDNEGVAYTLSESIYVDVIKEEEEKKEEGTANIIISNVSQSIDKPEAGDRLDITFDVENKSKFDATNLKVYAEGLTNATFIPIKSEPYQYIEKLKAGEKISVTLPLIISSSINEGLNNLTVIYKFTGGEGSVIIPVNNIQNEVEISSKPKLIISNYYADLEELRAGSTFNFTFDIYNTNAVVTAKNITVTLTQDENIFTVTQGSNSFFINKIAPGETASNTIELKVKSDATTKAYPLKLTIEYEYEGISPNPETGETGISKTEALNLQVVENARPMVDNIDLYSWDGGVIVGNNATLYFEFYNMGKSRLNNVIATLEGEGFTKADGTMQFIGNVESGNSMPVEMDVIPNMEGMVSGVLKITYEDSNGETVEFIKDFQKEVMSAPIVDPGIVDGGGEVFNPEVPMAKKPILPIWAFVIAQVVIFVLFVPITRKIIISIYKSKLRKKEREQY